MILRCQWLAFAPLYTAPVHRTCAMGAIGAVRRADRGEDRAGPTALQRPPPLARSDDRVRHVPSAASCVLGWPCPRSCHVRPTFSDERLHNTGVAWRDGRLQDEGGGHGTFKTPTLRDVARTAPYRHDGSLATLEDVVEFYDRGGNPNPALDSEIRPLKLNVVEKRQLQAFLRTTQGRIQGGTPPGSRRRTAARRSR